jgi:hypothetical protein
VKVEWEGKDFELIGTGGVVTGTVGTVQSSSLDDGESGGKPLFLTCSFLSFAGDLDMFLFLTVHSYHSREI